MTTESFRGVVARGVTRGPDLVSEPEIPRPRTRLGDLVDELAKIVSELPDHEVGEVPCSHRRLMGTKCADEKVIAYVVQWWAACNPCKSSI